MPERLRRSIGLALDRGLGADRGSTLGNLARYAKALGRTLHLSEGEQYLGLLGVLSSDYVKALMPQWSTDEDPGAALVTLHDQAPAISALDRLVYVDVHSVLPESLLLLSDKMAMATSLEVRVPFLDDRIVDFVRKVPSEFRLSGFGLKGLLKAAVKGVVPDFVLTRSKRGFGMPIGTWLRTDLRPMVRHYLDPARLREAAIFDPAVVSRIVEAHDTKRDDFTEPIVALLVFELWRDRFKLSLS
jgi:asparagine synthase (glutamine-hydrolysing)